MEPKKVQTFRTETLRLRKDYKTFCRLDYSKPTSLFPDHANKGTGDYRGTRAEKGTGTEEVVVEPLGQVGYLVRSTQPKAKRQELRMVV